MRTLQKKNPKLKKAVDELKFVSQNKKSRAYYEARRKTEMNYAARTNYLLEKAKLEGKIETAKQLLAWGMKKEQICKITGLKDSDF